MIEEYEEQNDAPELDSYERLSNSELTRHYLSARRAFRDVIKRAERISLGSGGRLSTGNRMFWASALFTRIVVTAKSVNQLLPNPKPGEHWDFSAVASLVRNLQEAALVYHWLCGSSITEEVREGRFILLYLHDYSSRRRLLSLDFIEDDPTYRDLTHRFDANPWLASFDPKKRKAALKGEKTPFVQDEVLKEIGADAKKFRTMYHGCRLKRYLFCHRRTTEDFP